MIDLNGVIDFLIWQMADAGVITKNDALAMEGKSAKFNGWVVSDAARELRKQVLSREVQK